MTELLQPLFKELKEKNHLLFSIVLYLTILFFFTPIYIKFSIEINGIYQGFFGAIAVIILIRTIYSSIRNILTKTFKKDYIAYMVIIISTIVFMFISKNQFQNHIAQLQSVIDNNYDIVFFSKFIIIASNKSVYWAFMRLSYIYISLKLFFPLLKTPTDGNNFLEEIHFRPKPVILQSLSLLLYTAFFWVLASSQILDRMFPV